MSTSATERIHDPVHRVSFRFETEGQSLWVFSRLEPGGHLPEHFHPTLEERWEVLEGTAEVKVDGCWNDLTAENDPVVVARGVRHELRNSSDGVAHLRTEVTPAGRLQEFLTESAQAAREGLYNARNLPTGLRGAAWLSEFALRFSDETVMCSPPPSLQSAVLPTAARLVRRRRRGHGERRTQMIKWAGRLIVLAGSRAHTGRPDRGGRRTPRRGVVQRGVVGRRPRQYEPCQQRVMAERGQLRRAAHRGRPDGAVAGPSRHHTSALHRMDAGDLDRG